MILSDTSNIGSLIQSVVAIGIGGIFLMCIVSFFLAIRDFVKSQGDSQAMKNGWNRIRFMIIGVILTMVFLFMLPVLMRYVGIDNYDLFTAQSIFSRMGDILNWLFRVGTDFRL